VQAVDKCFILDHIVGGGEQEVDHVPHAHTEGETKMNPASAPFFIKEPSKYIVQ
jgi:hypothetical protein